MFQILCPLSSLRPQWESVSQISDLFKIQTVRNLRQKVIAICSNRGDKECDRIDNLIEIGRGRKMVDLFEVFHVISKAKNQRYEHL